MLVPQYERANLQKEDLSRGGNVVSYNAILFALVAGVLSFILMDSINPILITNILLGAIVGILIDKKKS